MKRRAKRKKPYIKKYGEFSGFNVWIVDGFYVRNNIDPEFTNFGQHYICRYIPKKELWIDKDYSRSNEEQYFIQHMLVENKLMSNKIPYPIVRKKAIRAEMHERIKSKAIQGLMKKRGDRGFILNKIHKQLWKKYSNGVSVWKVDGKLVRSLLYIRFTEGGHDKVFRFIPKNEIWIDNSLSLKESKFILLHEIYERNLMCKGLYFVANHEKPKLLSDKSYKEIQFIYGSAHMVASQIEHFFRHHSEGLEAQLKEELDKTLLF